MGNWLQKFSLSSVIGILLLFFTACDNVVLPRLFHDKPITRVPIAVTLAFDQAFLDSTMEVAACGEPHQIQVGKVLSETILHVSGQSFATVTAQHGERKPMSVSNPTDLTIHLSIGHQSFDSPTRFGEEDTYKADLNFQLLAVYIDAKGNTLAQRPLDYSDRVSIWTPQDTSTTVTCATGQLEGAVKNAGDDLARDMLTIVPGLLGQAPQQVDVAQAPVFPVQPRVATAPSLSFRTMLRDGNDNLVLEGGENLVLHIEITNESNVPISSANIDLSGTQAIVQAFTHITPLPVSIGTLQPGEKKSTEVRGRMPTTVNAERGELIVSIKSEEGVPAASHQILAAIGPSMQSSRQNGTQFSGRPIQTTPSPQATKPQPVNPSLSPYYAIIVSIDEYRDPWSHTHQIPRTNLKGLIDVLRTTGRFSKDHIRVLHGKHATRPDIEEILSSWARTRMNQDSILLFYFVGHALADPRNGDVFLVPYEGSIQASTKRLISLRSLQRVLGKLQTKLTLLFLDTPVIQYLGNGSIVGLNGDKPPNWQGGLLTIANHEPLRIIQIRSTSRDNSGDLAKLLSGLLGRADRNQNGTITVGEFLQDLDGTAEIIPVVPQNSSEARIILAQ